MNGHLELVTRRKTLEAVCKTEVKNRERASLFMQGLCVSVRSGEKAKITHDLGQV